jgi:hypothetical protein
VAPASSTVLDVGGFPTGRGVSMKRIVLLVAWHLFVATALLASAMQLIGACEAHAQVSMIPDEVVCPTSAPPEYYVTEFHRLAVCVPGQVIEPQQEVYLEWATSSDDGASWISHGHSHGYSTILSWYIRPRVWDQIRVRWRPCASEDLATCTGEWSQPSAAIVVLPNVDFDGSHTVTSVDLVRVWQIIQRVVNKQFDGQAYK